MKKDKVLERFRKRKVEAKQAWSAIHKDFNDDKKFIQMGQQLDSRQQQKLKGRPQFVINKLLSMVKSVTNEMRKTVIAGKVYPIDNGADIDKAKVRQGVVRGIERTSRATYSYRYAGEEAVTGGMGAWRVNTKYVSDKSFDQTIVKKRILDASTVSYGPCVEPDYSDAKWCIIEQKAEPLNRWSKAWGAFENPASHTDRLDPDVWGRAALPYEFEYWELEEIPDTLYRLKVGRSVFKSQMKPDTPEELFVQRDGKRLERKTVRKQWWQFKLKAGDFTEKPVKWPGKYCPIVVVNGREVWSEGKRRLLSLCRYSKESQRLYNYARQEMARRLGQSPKATWLIAIEAIPAAFMDTWKKAHEQVVGMLPWNAFSKDGKPNPEPKPPTTQPLDPALVQEAVQTDMELKDTTGIQAENLAMHSNATSKVAIDAKKNEGDTITFDFQDNLAIAVQHSLRITMDLVPKVIDTARQIRMVGEDEQEKVITANQEYKDKKTGETKLDYYFNEEEEYDMGVTVGPSFESKRMENSDNLMALMEKSQDAAEVLPHMYVKLLDFNGADEAAKILKKVLNIRYPGLVEPDEDELEQGQQPLPPDVQQKLQQAQELQQAFQQMQQELQEIKASKDVEFAKINQQAKSDEAKIMQQHKAVMDKLGMEQQGVNVKKFEAVTNRMELESKERAENDKLITDGAAKVEAAKAETEAKFQGQLDSALKQFGSKMDAAQKAISQIKVPEQTQQPVNVTVNMPAKGGKKTIKPNKAGGFDVEEDGAK